MAITLEDVRKRFEETLGLVQFLPMLREYIFMPGRIEWLATADVDKVFRYCAEVDE